jgi:hypothetical protein
VVFEPLLRRLRLSLALRRKFCVEVEPLPGAERMAACAAARAGAGLTTMAVTEIALPTHAAALNIA